MKCDMHQVGGGSIHCCSRCGFVVKLNNGASLFSRECYGSLGAFKRTLEQAYMPPTVVLNLREALTALADLEPHNTDLEYIQDRVHEALEAVS